MWLQGADPAALRIGSVLRGEREEASSQGEADPGDPVNPYPSPTLETAEGTEPSANL